MNRLSYTMCALAIVMSSLTIGAYAGGGNGGGSGGSGSGGGGSNPDDCCKPSDFFSNLGRTIEAKLREKQTGTSNVNAAKILEGVMKDIDSIGHNYSHGHR